MDYSAIAAAIEATGLLARGGFHPGTGEGVPALADAQPTRTLILVGNAGPAMWQAFARSRAAYAGDHALDGWTRARLAAVAERLGARALFPFTGPPYLPFQRWAMRAEAVWPSPLGLLIHPEYGLWHAYRGALAFAEEIELPARDPRPNPCSSCAQKPCLSGCPVDAFADRAYDVNRCSSHLRVAAGADCMQLGCGARRACPVGRTYRYAPSQAGFHMQAFLRSHGDRRGGASSALPRSVPAPAPIEGHQSKGDEP